MPRLADHEQRRREITDAVRRVIARSGLEGTTFQSVAAEAGISVRLVQYYFGNKKELLNATHHAVITDAALRFGKRLTTLTEPASPRETLRIIATELMPLDEQRRADAVVLANFHAATLSGDGASIDRSIGTVNALVDVIAEQLRRAGAPPDLATLDAQVLALCLAGFAQGLVADDTTAEHAETLLARLFDRFLPPDARS
ncbi:TetR/AcrR family transcriptional regulator [Nocardia terpenica]|uniref:TetR family transcriptional regulator n=1 Tax=Nocardia terpenica TaxID=455432 RepID=A0A291RKX2_9NOCA|nr:TetR/AcrR family transcriptional regulator [Nocardia terpenica]ATL68236.1 TetR family transcriptional regulator [Nocardia terpenica]